MLAAAVFAAICTEVLPVGLLPQISRGLQTSESRVGLLVSAYAVVVAIGSIPLTALVARWPRRHVLCTLLCLYALSNAALASTNNYWFALCSRLLGGLAHAGFFSLVIAAAVSIVAPAKAGKAVALVLGGNVLALALGVPLGTALGTAIGWRWAFACAAAVMLLLALLTAVVLPSAQPPPSASPQIPVLTMVREQALLRVATFTIILMLGHYTLYTYISPLLLHASVSTGAVSLVLFGYGAAGILGLGLASAAADRNPRRALQAAAALTTACLLALSYVHASTPTVAVVIVWGIAFGALPTLIQSVALRAVPNARDAAPAVVNATFNIGIAGGAFIGARELFIASPSVLALTAAGLGAVSLLLLAQRSNTQ
ncbi:MAG: MFS transporter [Actinomycetota bacterium]|nr:MFS transporter [Actinomycetota bacterium]